MITAELIEPDYDAELRYIRTEMEYVERKIAEKGRGLIHKLSWPSVGILSHKDWLAYRRALKHYYEKLLDYADDVEDGVLPVKFAVHNAANRADQDVALTVLVHGGRIDTAKQPPVRPERADGAPGQEAGVKWPRLTGFRRRDIKISEHSIGVVLSKLGAKDHAMLVNQLVHVHCGPDTDVEYEVRSQNVPHETGPVEF
jgi:hypothetical protein